MHIVTGLLMAGLLGRRQKKQGDADPALRSPLLRVPSVLSVVHALPGRTRFRVPALVGATEAAGKLQTALAGIEAVRSATVSTVTGSVLIEHDAERVAPDVLAAALIRMLGLERQITGEVEAALTRELREIAQALDRAVYERTGGLLDLKTALFCLMVVIGVNQVLKQGPLALPAGFTLLWWAGNGLLRGRQSAT